MALGLIRTWLERKHLLAVKELKNAGMAGCKQSSVVIDIWNFGNELGLKLNARANGTTASQRKDGEDVVGEGKKEMRRPMRLAILISAEPAIISKKLSDQEYWTPCYPILPNKSQLQPPKNPTGKERKHFKNRLTTQPMFGMSNFQKLISKEVHYCKP